MAQSAASPHHVEINQSRANAQLTKQHFFAMRLAGLSDLAGAALSDTPIPIYDLNGEPLFHDYPLVDGSAIVGTIRMAANRALGAPVVSVLHSAPGWSPDAALRMATEALHQREPEARVIGCRLVCYAYPKIGIQLEYECPGRGPASDVFDASSGQRVADSTDPHHQFTRYSLLGRLQPNEVTARVASFHEAERQIASHRQASDHLPETVFGPIWLPPIIIGLRQGTVKLSPYCPNSPPGLTHYAQITDYFCVDASTQMLLEHYGWNYTQNQIATAMGTNAAQGGTTQDGLTTGFASLTDNTLVLTFDWNSNRAQQFQDAVTEINANRPLFTQVPHHYRVCMGYQENLFIPLWLSLGLGQMLYIYDPWPWNPDLCSPGAAYWESWATSPVMWFGIVHHG
jgi:hypothetical protein